MNINLTGKKAIICGASKGIGRAIAIELAALGASVTLLARNEQTLSELCKTLETKAGQYHHFLAVDLANTQELKAVITDYVTQSGPFHILINNSGGPKAGSLHAANENDFSAAFTQHVMASHVLMLAVLNGMKEEQYGRIINIISTSVKQPIAGLGISNTIRGAVANWSKTLAGEVAKFGITVNNVLPGSTETERLTEIIANKASKNHQSLEEVIEHEKSIIPAGRFGAPEEIAQAVAFLASPAAAYINGINLPVDGGRTASL
ncbi:MAG: SDR family oxidoreductase [Pseudomonadota bacterium]